MLYIYIQLSDPCIGSPSSTTTFNATIQRINALQKPPKFIVISGNMTNTSPEDQESYNEQVLEFKSILQQLNPCISVVREMVLSNNRNILFYTTNIDLCVWGCGYWKRKRRIT